MSEHHASVLVHAPVHQVYELFTHFNDFPKFMSFVKEVTYHDDQRSHWVAHMLGSQEWDAVNEDWIQDRQIGWRSINGLENSGRVKFIALGSEQTQVDVFISYKPPAGMLGEAVDRLALESRFAQVLQEDLDNFARMVEEAPPGALDPMQSYYLFHNESAIARGQVTERQQQAMMHDPMMQPAMLQAREEQIQREKEEYSRLEQEQLQDEQLRAEQTRRAAEEQRLALEQQAERDREAELEREREEERYVSQKRPIDPVYNTIGGRNAAMERTALGDQDASRERFPGHVTDPMTARNPRPGDKQETTTPVAETETESPWHHAIRGTASSSESGERELERSDGTTEGSEQL